MYLKLMDFHKNSHNIKVKQILDFSMLAIAPPLLTGVQVWTEEVPEPIAMGRLFDI